MKKHALSIFFCLAAFAHAKGDLDADSVTVNDRTPDPGDFVTVRWRAINRTGDYIGGSQQGVMFSTDSTINHGDTRLAKEYLGPLGGWLPDTSNETKTFVKIPTWAVPGTQYWIGIYADYDRDRSESNENNNNSGGVSIRIRGADLIAKDVSMADNLAAQLAGYTYTEFTAYPQENVYVSWTAENIGNRSSGGTKQAVVWYHSSDMLTSSGTLKSGVTVIETDGLATLGSGNTRSQGQNIEIPADVEHGKTYYLGIYADYENEEREYDESGRKNNLSNLVEVTVSLPSEATYPQVSDYNYLPDLDFDDGAIIGGILTDNRLQDTNNDQSPNRGATMNPSRCFTPGDRAYLHATVNHTNDFLGLFNGRLETRLAGSYRPVGGSYTSIGTVQQNVGTISDRRLNLRWNVPGTPGDYQVRIRVEVELENRWYTFKEEVIPVTVSTGRPIVLVHGWSDVGGDTFGNLEVMLEMDLNRPVRFFQYETAKFPFLQSGDGPRIDEGFDGKDSLAEQLRTFLEEPENNNRPLNEVDLIAHSMGGLVAKNYLLLEPEKVRRFITLGTPSYGGLFADTAGSVLNNQAEDLEFGCPVSWKIHEGWQRRLDEMPDLFAVVGTNDAFPGRYNQSDKVVLCSSASAENLGFPVYYVPLEHSGEHGMTAIMDHAHESWEPIRDFLTNVAPGIAGNLPGHNGGVDDVGDRSHHDPLSAGQLYIVGPGSTGDFVVAVDSVSSSASYFLVSGNGINRHDIYSAYGITANSASSGSEAYTFVDVVVQSAGGTFKERVKIKTGETTVYAINGFNPHLTELDQDGDGLPNELENLLIDADRNDAITNQNDLAPGVDPDGDGRVLILEWLTGSNPLVGDGNPVECRMENGRFILRHPRGGSIQGFSLKGLRNRKLDQSWSEAGVSREEMFDGFIEWSIPVDEDQEFLKLGVIEEGE